ncbi:hypothetical protein EV2_026711 [Malus domestica]
MSGKSLDLIGVCNDTDYTGGTVYHSPSNDLRFSDVLLRGSSVGPYPTHSDLKPVRAHMSSLHFMDHLGIPAAPSENPVRTAAEGRWWGPPAGGETTVVDDRSSD